MSLGVLAELAVRGRLYPSVILHGADSAGRVRAAVRLARALLCAASPEERPCGACRHCRRIGRPGEAGRESYHPDFEVLERDLRTSTSVAATKQMLRGAQVSPFEARGQVFVIAAAESLTGEAANALLKGIEEPHETAPRHFLLLAPSRLDLLPTLRSRSLSYYLGPPEPVNREEVDPLAEALTRAVSAWSRSGASVHLLLAAGALGEAAGKEWSDPRAARPWTLAAEAVVAAVRGGEVPELLHRPLLDLAADLLQAPELRLRGIPKERILEGLVAKRLAPLRSALQPRRRD